jgi:hypothetical protein
MYQAQYRLLVLLALFRVKLEGFFSDPPEQLPHVVKMF